MVSRRTSREHANAATPCGNRSGRGRGSSTGRRPHAAHGVYRRPGASTVESRADHRPRAPGPSWQRARTAEARGREGARARGREGAEAAVGRPARRPGGGGHHLSSLIPVTGSVSSAITDSAASNAADSAAGLAAPPPSSGDDAAIIFPPLKSPAAACGRLTAAGVGAWTLLAEAAGRLAAAGIGSWS